MNTIIAIGSWVVIISVHIIYVICLSGVAIEDILLLGDEQENEWERFKQFKLVGVVLLIAGLLWLLSNTGVGLICLIICSITFSTCETRARQPDGGDETSNVSPENTTRNSAIQAVKYLIRCLIGIWWVWSHLNELVLYIIPPIAFIVFIVSLFRDVGARQDHNDEVVNVNNANSNHDLVNRLLNPLCSLVIYTFLIYKIIIYASRKVWDCLRTRRGTPGGRDTDTDTRTPIPAHRDNEEGSPSSSSPNSENNFNVTLNAGNNENHGGTQTHGAVIVAKVIQILVTQEGRRSCSSVVIWLFVGLASIYLFVGVTTTTTITS